jgi:hypothetical protein
LFSGRISDVAINENQKQPKTEFFSKLLELKEYGEDPYPWIMSPAFRRD